MFPCTYSDSENPLGSANGVNGVRSVSNMQITQGIWR